MRTFYLSGNTEQSVMMILLFLTLIFSLYLLILSYKRYGKKKKCLPYGVIFLFLFGILYILTDIYTKKNLGLLYQDKFSVSMWLLWGMVIGMNVFLLWKTQKMYQERKQIPDRNAIKEALDQLPEGVCYFTSTGAMKLCNLQMYQLFYQMAGKDLQNFRELKKALRDHHPSIRQVLLDDTSKAYLFPDGKVWCYKENKVSGSSKSIYTEVVFSNLTEQYQKNMELKEQTRQLKEIAGNLRRLSDNAKILIREKEVLAAKTKLHDQIGAALIAVRKLLTNQGSDEEEAILRLLHQAINGMKNDNKYLREQGEFDKFLQDAKSIGVNVHVQGTLPEQDEISRVFIIAMRECLTNGVRHANATELRVKIEKKETSLVLQITNNGLLPKQKIVPKGGLHNLYSYVMYYGGTMRIQSKPHFKLEISIPGGKGNGL